MFNDDETAKIINGEIKRSEDKWLTIIAWILIFMGIIMFFTSAKAKDCIPVKDANKRVRANQDLISRLVYENRILRERLKQREKQFDFRYSTL